jgi:diguanylate cyclase
MAVATQLAGCAPAAAYSGLTLAGGALVSVVAMAGILHQTRARRLRASQERQLWEAFAEATRGLSQLDETAVIVAALHGVRRLFGPDRAELVICRGSRRRRRRYRVGAATTPPASGFEPGSRVGSRVGSEVGSEVGFEVGHRVARRLVIGQLGAGEMLLDFRSARPLAPHQHHALSAYADAVASALHDASTRRRLRLLAANSGYEAVYDRLTGLLRRSSLLARGDAVLRRLAPTTPLGLAVFDVVGMGDVNGTLGTAAGDELLRTVARRLAGARAGSDLLGRLGDDEYALLMVGEPNPVGRTASITAALSAPAPVADVMIAVELHAGVCGQAAAGAEMAELLRRAEIALHQGKRSGQRVAGYDADTDSANVDRLVLLAELRDALATSDQIDIALQPVVDLDSGKPIAVEALVRWRHPRRGEVAPTAFIDVLERSDMVVGFTRYVLDLSLRYAAKWFARGLTLPVCVNVGARALLDTGLPGLVESRLAVHGLPADRLIVEITEQVMLADVTVAAGVIAALRLLGVRIYVDDFGTGSSSLAFLTQVPVDGLKIDRSFVEQMGDSAEAAAIVATTVDLAGQLGVLVVAEGVETAQQRSALRALGVGAAQGFLFYRPLSLDRLDAVLFGIE